jgi:hypothetical protein
MKVAAGCRCAFRRRGFGPPGVKGDSVVRGAGLSLGAIGQPPGAGGVSP